MEIRKIFASLVVGLVGTAVLSISSMAAQTYTVAEGDNITAVINEAQDGDIIEITAANPGAFTINKAITVKGVGDVSIVDYQYITIAEGIVGEVTIQNIDFFGTTNHIIYFNGNDYSNLDLTIDGCYIEYNANRGIYIENKELGALKVNNCVIENKASSYVGSYAIWTNPTAPAKMNITGNQIIGKGALRAAVHVGDYATDGSEITISGNTISGVERGVQVANQSANVVIDITNNVFSDINLCEGSTKSAEECAVVFLHANAKNVIEVNAVNNVATDVNAFVYSENAKAVTEFFGDVASNTVGNSYVDVNNKTYIPVAVIGEKAYGTLQAAINAAEENDVITLTGTVEEGKITLPVTVKNLTIDGDGNIIKNTVIQNADKLKDNISGLTIDGVIFDNSRIYINGWTAGMIFKDWEITNCTFTGLESTTSVGGVIQFNLSSGMIVGQYGPYNDCALENFTFTGNTINGAHCNGVCSGINSQAMEGTIIIENNVFNDIDFNAIQMQNVPENATVSMKNNAFTNMGGNILHLNNNLADVDIHNNVFVAASESKYYITHISTEIDATGNFFGIGDSVETAVFDPDYAAKMHLKGGTSVIYGYYTDTALNEYKDLVVATIGETKYTSLQAAVDAAVAGDTIVIANDIYAEVLPTADSTSNDANALIHTDKDDVIVIDLNGKTISVKGADEAKYDTLAIRNNGNLTITDTSADKDGKITFSFDGTQESGSSQIHSTILNFGILTLEAGIIENKATTGYGKYTVNNYSWGGSASFTMNGGAVINDTTIAVYADAYSDSGENFNIITINDGIIEGGVWFNARNVAADTKLTVNGGEIYATNYSALTIKESTAGTAVVSVTDGIFKSETGVAVNASDTIARFISGGVFSSDVSAYLDTTKYACAEYADGMYKIVDEKYAVEAIRVEFSSVLPAVEGEMLYNINLVATDSDIINRLNSVDLTFVLTQKTGNNEFEIIASNEEIAVNPVNNSKVRYEFHYEGKDGVKTDVGNIITIGQVKFTGYGIFEFAVDSSDEANETNAAHATTLYDNIVDTFIPDGNTAVISDGELVLDNSTTGEVLIAVPTRDLKIVIYFPNSVKVDNGYGYQDMKVVVSGGDLDEAIVVDLGAGAEMPNLVTEVKTEAAVAVDYAAGNYVVTLTDVLCVNNSYNVEVSGAGYRTARYTVTMTDDKTLNFWNNVKDNAVAIEENKNTMKTNFLAGDIVKDNNINIYDLSAVVSYFGEINLNDGDDFNAYAKYDLNRDGKIDSKDVAYVLVSWNN